MNRKVILLLLILVSVCAISHAAAADVSPADNLTDTDTEIIEETNDIEEVSAADEQAGDDKVSVNPEYREIQNLIDNAGENGLVTLNGTTYACDYLITINRNVTLDGNGSTLVFDGSEKSYTSSFFYINYTASGVTLKNLKFIGGKMFFGGAITWHGDNGNLVNCTFMDNEANGIYAIGGAVLVLGNNLNVTDCTFKHNQVDKYGGAILWNGTGGSISNCEFTGNEAKDFSDAGDDGSLYGGGALLLCSDDCIVTNCTFSNNLASECGGAIAVLGNRNVRIKDSKFYNNNVSGLSGGGAIYTACEGLIIDNCIFIGNNANNSIGGAVSLSIDTVVKNSFFNSNFAIKDEAGYVYGNDLVYDGNATQYNNNIIFNTFILDFEETIQNAIGVMSKEVYDLVTSENQNNSFNKTKRNSTVEFGEIGMIFEYARSGNIKVVVSNGIIEQKNILVLSQDKSRTVAATIIPPTKDNDNVITISGLEVGNYFLRVTTTPDENYIEATKELSITVNMATAAIKASTITVAYKKGSLWTVKIVDARDNKPISGMKLTLKVYTGNKFATVNLNTNARGEASYQTKGLSAATHKVVVSGSHKGYKLNPVTSSIKVVKQTALKIKVKSKKISIGAVLSITVLNKKTKKGVNGVKIQLLIKDGKKYKTVILKTKKKGKTKGFCGYATNKLTVGKHSVKITPVEIKYAGSASSSMKITAKAKKVPAWETKA